MIRNVKVCFVMIVVLLSALTAEASVVIHGTRVIYPSDARDVTVTVENNGSFPVVVQAWLDTGDPSTVPEDSTAPFILHPPLFRLDPKQTQSLRLVYTQDAIPADRESVYWLNVLEIPPEDASLSDGSGNQLQLIFRSRIKVFLRPQELAGSAGSAPSQVQWTLANKADGSTALQATNPTAYHVTFSRIAVNIDGVRYEAAGGMVDPGESMELPLSESVAGESESANAEQSGDIQYAYLNDYGVSVEGQATLRADG